jgi:uncharacterized protein YhaN
MRIRELDLLRYGHFTDASMALPASTPDIHMVLGENEAGKSTSMAGAEDLLWHPPEFATQLPARIRCHARRRDPGEGK